MSLESSVGTSTDWARLSSCSSRSSLCALHGVPQSEPPKLEVGIGGSWSEAPVPSPHLRELTREGQRLQVGHPLYGTRTCAPGPTPGASSQSLLTPKCEWGSGTLLTLGHKGPGLSPVRRVWGRVQAWGRGSPALNAQAMGWGLCQGAGLLLAVALTRTLCRKLCSNSHVPKEETEEASGDMPGRGSCRNSGPCQDAGLPRANSTLLAASVGHCPGPGRPGSCTRPLLLLFCFWEGPEPPLHSPPTPHMWEPQVV